MKECGAKTRSGAPCKNMPCVGRERCRMHGGMSARAGPTHHNWKHGRRSKVLDARYSGALDGLTIQGLYHVNRTDPKLLQLNEDIALLVAKQQETLEGLNTGESPAAWEALAVLAGRACKAHRDGRDTELGNVLEAIAGVVGNGVGEAAVWEEFTARAEQIRKLVDTQRKYEEGLRMYLPLDQARALFALWQDAISRAVPREYIAKIHEELQKSRPGKTAANLH